MTHDMIRVLLNKHHYWYNNGNDDLKPSFACCNLRGFNFDKSFLCYANMSGSDLSGTSFVGAMAECVNFSYTNLQGVSFRGANLRYSNFLDTDLRGACFAGARLTYTVFPPHIRIIRGYVV